MNNPIRCCFNTQWHLRNSAVLITAGSKRVSPQKDIECAQRFIDTYLVDIRQKTDVNRDKTRLNGQHVEKD